jgi:small-conductance mechanosensitive channel
VDKVAGIVKEIRARSTTVVTNDNISIIVPNSHFIEKPNTNWTHGDPKVRFRIPISVAYGSDVQKVCATLIGVGREHPASLAVPEPGVFFNGFGDSALDFELVVWSEQMSYRPRRFRSDLNFAIEEKFREAGIVIPFPQREVRLLGEPGEQASGGSPGS